MRDFHRVNVWHKAHAVTLEVYQATRGFPKEELYGLTSQMRRAAASVAASEGGKVGVNGAGVNGATPRGPGDELRIRKTPFEYRVTVRALATHRGPPRVAAGLYDESPEGKRLRERLAEQLRLAPSLRYEGKGRPTKKDRREIAKLRGD